MEPKKHHYLPQFLLKQWVGSDGRLCQFSKPRGDIVKPLRVFPAQTGFQNRLYSLRSWPEDVAHTVEKFLFKPVDTNAAIGLDFLNRGIPKEDWPFRVVDAWATFLLSLHLRMPEDLAILRERWSGKVSEIIAKLDSDRQQDIDATPLADREREFEGEVFTILSDLTHSDVIRRKFIEMHWSVVTFHKVAETLYFSDRPIFRTAPLASRDGALLMPIGPKQIFVAANDLRVLQRIIADPSKANLRETNKLVVSQANNYAYSIDDTPLRFMQNNFGTFVEDRPISGTRTS